MKPGLIQEASKLLYALRERGQQLDELPDDMRPQTREDGYAIQAHWEHFSATPLMGWKIAATSLAGQTHIGVDGPLAGRILREMAIPPAGICPFANNHMRVAELEFAFRMAATLAPQTNGYSMADVMNSVESLHLAIEIPNSRYHASNQVGAAQLIADNACANYFVLGPAVTADWKGIDLAGHQVCGFVNDGPPQMGVGANVLGGPYVALHWLANELSRSGMVMREGQIVSTGTCVAPMAIAPGDHIRGDFGPLGTIEVHIEG